jgi:hypothetical protein
MTQHIKFPSIEQFRNVVKQVRENSKYHGVANPTLTFTGTVKLHGTNHAVCQNWVGEIYTQSRERITTPENDNHGSSAWTHDNRGIFRWVFDNVREVLDVGDDDVIQIFGEWCGGNVQKGVGLQHLPKQFIVFGIRVSKDSESQVFLDEWCVRSACKDLLTTIYDFPMWKLQIDFNYPELAQQQLVGITNLVEQDCPVARKLLGPDFAGELIGEGVVWSTEFRGSTIRFKVKGEKHSSSKVKTLAPVDVERMNSIQEFVDSVITPSRLNQGLENVPSRDVSNTGAFIKWVVADVIKEESDTMEASGFTTKEVTSKLANAARIWFLASDI